MSDARQLSQLAQLAEADYQRKEQSFQKIISEENAIRSDLRKLDESLRASREGAQEIYMRALGADILWESLIGRRKAELNMKLARVLARKEQQIGVMRKAFGRREVTREMLESARGKMRVDRLKRELDQAIIQTIFARR